MNEENKVSIGNPSGFLLYVFAMQVFLYCGIVWGLFSGDTYLLYGVVSLVCFPIYVIGGIMLCKRNGPYEAYIGNLYIMFGTLFAGIMGVAYVAYFLDGIFGWGLEPTFLGVPMIVGGVVLIPAMIPYRFAPWVEFTVWSIVVIWIVTGGIGFYMGGYFLFVVNMWLALISGIGVTYLCMNEFLKMVGTKGLPMGKPIFKFPE